MRKTWCSSKTAAPAVELAASASVVPNGFSMITRTSAPRAVQPVPPSCSTMTGRTRRGRQVEARLQRLAGVLVEARRAAPERS
jgi:hypothetical protein